MTTFLQPESCCVCGYESFITQHGGFYSCTRCEHWQRIPLPPFNGHNPTERYPERYLHHVAAKYINRYVPLDSRRGILDGNGELGGIALLLAHKNKLTLVDYMHASTASLRGVVVEPKNFLQFLQASVCFDGMYLYRVVDQLQHPHIVLQAARKGLSDGGLLVITVPNKDCAAHKRYGDRFNFIQDNGLRQLFSYNTLVMLVRDNGFRPVGFGYPWRGIVTWSNFRQMYSRKTQLSPLWRHSLMTLAAIKDG